MVAGAGPDRGWVTAATVTHPRAGAIVAQTRDITSRDGVEMRAMLDLSAALDAVSSEPDDHTRRKAWGAYVSGLSDEARRYLAANLGEVMATTEPARDLGPGWVRRVDRFLAILREAKPGKKPPIRAGIPGDVESRLRLSVYGDPVKSMSNYAIILRHDPRWAGMVRYNELAGSVYVDDAPVTDPVLLRIAEQIDETYRMPNGDDLLAKALRLVAEENRYHPVRDYLSGLTWDGEPRISTMLGRYFGAPDLPHVRAIGFRWLISCVARAMNPGCKVDTMLVLVGAQGAGKSTGAKVLAGDWFSDAEIDPHNNTEAVIAIQGSWIVEIAEWDKWTGRDQRIIKAFISRPVDQIRPKYGRFREDFPRQCVFIGTTNSDELFDDPTGSRRFLPVRVGRVDLEAIVRDRDQLWAEALAAYRAGESWVFDATETDAIKADAEGYRTSDAWEASILGQLLGRSSVVVEDLFEAMQVPLKDRNKMHQLRVAWVLRGAGWARKKERVEGVPRWVWRRVPDPPGTP